MEKQSNININNSSRVVYVGLASIIANLKTKKECRWYKNQVIMIYILGLYFPPYSCYDVDFILQFGADKKKVSLYLIL